MSSTNSHVAIIGAGLSGLTLALALHQQGIASTIYESRPAPLNIGGAVMLSPNALRILDALDMYRVVAPLGYSFDQLEFRDADENVTETYEFGHAAKYGFRGLRIYRYELINALLAALQDKGVRIQYGRKFARVVSDSSDSRNKDSPGVTFAFADGQTETAALLVGADGIHSTVRKHLYPDLETTFMGMAGITAAVPTAQLQLPADGSYHLPVTIVSPAHGAFVIAPQGADGAEVLIGKQRRVLEADQLDRDAAVAFLQQDAAHFPAIVRNAVSRIDAGRINVWPFYVVPKLDCWASASRRVVILGDAAHAIPPSAGQGINQAFEDVYMLALLLGRASASFGGDGNAGDWQAALEFWQQYRQARIDRVFALNHQIDLRRMPAGDASSAGAAREAFDLEWLYKPDVEKDVNDWVAAQDRKGGLARDHIS